MIAASDVANDPPGWDINRARAAIGRLSRMSQPAHINGRMLVVIRPRTSLLGGCDIIESGKLEHDGEVLHLVGDHGSRAVTDAEWNALQPVVQGGGIAACRGFDFFLLRPAVEY